MPLQLRLERFLQRRRVTNIEAMCSAMGRAEITVRQALAKLDYLTSFNQNSRFYTLRSLARFDRHGIWRHSKASFTRYGTLAKLLVALVDGSCSGHTGVELEKIAGGTVQVALGSLSKRQHLVRIRSGGPVRLLYYPFEVQAYPTGEKTVWLDQAFGRAGGRSDDGDIEENGCRPS